MKKTLVLIASIFLINCQMIAQKSETIAVTQTKNANQAKLPLVEDGPIKNVILIIGDGTGLAQITAGQFSLVGLDGNLALQRMPVTGIVRTHAANTLITDSAAGATAYSCGKKTDNGKIAWLPDGKSCKTLLEIAEELGKSTGLVATSTITHATPASFAAHVESRRMQPEIAEQYLDSGVEVFLGGGKEFFIPQNEEGSSRKDSRNLVEEFKASGYGYVENVQQMEEDNSSKILGLFADKGMPSEVRTPTLSEMTEKALQVLSKNEKGFFLMVEASQVDWGGHGNDAEYVIREVKDLDAAVKTAVDFAQEDGETLVILTADHETGGMTFQKSPSGTEELEIFWTTDYHTGIPTPLMAYGPHAIRFTGWHDNTAIGILIAELAGYPGFPAILE